jgi:hypothetical protein
VKILGYCGLLVEEDAKKGWFCGEHENGTVLANRSWDSNAVLLIV